MLWRAEDCEQRKERDCDCGLKRGARRQKSRRARSEVIHIFFLLHSQLHPVTLSLNAERAPNRGFLYLGGERGPEGRTMRLYAPSMCAPPASRRRPARRQITNDGIPPACIPADNSKARNFCVRVFTY